MIDAQHITKRFGGIEAVKDVSFHIEKGEIVGFLGPNGAGKTTTMRILACFIPPTSGHVKIDGLDVTRHSLRVRKKIGYSLEKASLYPDMRVLPFLRFVSEVKGNRGKKVKNAAAEVLALCGLEGVKERIIQNLSKGYQQRLTLAQALMNQPDVLILDEPTVGLDPENVSEIRHLIKSLSEDRTIILSSHILSEVSMICNKVMIMDSGSIIAADTPENLGLLLQKGQVIDLQIEGHQSRVMEAVEALPGVRKVQVIDTPSENMSKYRLESVADADIFPKLNEIAHEHGWILREMTPVSMTLEEIFLKMVNKKSAARQ